MLKEKVNNLLTYLLFSVDDFAIINPYDGVVTVAKLLNTERTSVYNLTVMAADDGNLAGGTSENSTVCII